MPSTFGQLLRHYRARAGLTKSELAEALGAGRSSIADWEAEKRVPRDRARLQDLAQVLRLTPDEAAQLATLARGRPARLASGDSQRPIGKHGDDGAHATSLTPRRHQLRAPIADFVGRADEAEHVVQAMQTAAAQGRAAMIAAVLGMGGVGKTELAYHVAHRLRHTFPDGQIVVELQGSSSTPLTSTQALQQLIQAFKPQLRLPDAPDALPSLYRTLLHNRRVLILADDARDAAQLRPLIPPAGSALLITSRQRFSLPGMITIQLEQLDANTAVTFLHTICPRLSDAEACSIAQVCGYLPLALRVSGSILNNLPSLSVSSYLARLANEQRCLTHLCDPEDRQLDVAGSLMLSYVLLEAPAQQVFRQLGVLAADFSSEMALAMIEAAPDIDGEATLHLLLRRNLVMYDALRARWQMHDLVRALARRLLAEAGELEAVGWRYARAVVQIARAIQDQYLAGGDGVLAALARFDTERAHIDAARAWMSQYAGTVAGDTLLRDEALATLTIGDLRYDKRRERLRHLECARAAAQRLRDRRAEGRLLNALGIAYYTIGDLLCAGPSFEAAYVCAKEQGDRYTEARALRNLGIIATDQRQVRLAIRYYEQALTLARTTGDVRSEGVALVSLGSAHMELGEAQPALPCCELALSLARTAGDMRAEGMALASLGHIYAALGALQEAIGAYERWRAIATAIGDQASEALALSNLGRIYAEMGELQRGRTYAGQALEMARAGGDRRYEGYALKALGYISRTAGDAPQAVALFAQALSILEDVGDQASATACRWQYGLALAQQEDCERALPLLRTCVAYEQSIGHAQAASHTALLTRLEAGEALSLELAASIPGN
jgi:tetratricopeptide (TPR) repeat protein/transcriptional regulator with XRE-family HTH domain